MDVNWLDDREQAAWVRLAAVLELMPGVLDTQLRRDAALSHFEYMTLAMLSQAPHHTLRMTALSQQTHATLPRLSHVVKRLEERGLVQRFPCPEDARATNARLTPEGWQTVVATAPGHVANVRRHVFDALTPEQVHQLALIADAVLTRVDPDKTLTTLADRYPIAPGPPAGPSTAAPSTAGPPTAATAEGGSESAS